MLTCLICGNKRTKVFVHADKLRRLKLVRCDVCCTSWHVPFPTKQELVVWYSKKSMAKRWKGNLQNAVKVNYEQNKENFEFNFSILQNQLHSCDSKAVLDIGCYNGEFLNMFYGVGFLCVGIDLNEGLLELGRIQFPGLKLLHGCLDDFVFTKKFSVITFHQVLEHVIDPVDFIRAVKNNLLDSGVIQFSVPDASLNKKIDYPSHLWHFTEKSLVKLLQTTGLIGSTYKRTNKAALVCVAKKKPETHQMSSYEEIKKHWDDLAAAEDVSYKASWGDYFMVQKEIDTVSKYIKNGDLVCDIGCNNGYCDFRLLELFGDLRVVGVDYSSEAIRRATAYAHQANLANRASFFIGSILVAESLPIGQHFDVVMAKRTIINLNSDDDQIKALNNLKALLKNGSKVVLMEAVEKNLKRLNNLRVEFGLDELQQPWHNRYLSDAVVAYIRDNFIVHVDECYSSSYYLVSRLICPMVQKMCDIKKDDHKNDYLSETNRLAYLLPNFGDYGIQHLFVLSQKH